MKILTCGISPYILLSNGNLHKNIIEHIYKKRFSIASLVWSHDTTLNVPTENGYTYEFLINEKKHQIPILPFNRGKNESIEIYEHIKQLDPDCFLTIGKISDHLYIKAVKMFALQNKKWIAVITDGDVNLENEESQILDDADYIICTSFISYQKLKQIYSEKIDFQFVGSDFKVNQELISNEKVSVLGLGKTCQSDNLNAIIESVNDLEVDLRIHANTFEQGEIDLEFSKNNSDNENIFFPEKYVSVFDGFSKEEMCNIYKKTDIFVYSQMETNTLMSVFESISCGCFPLMIRTPTTEHLAYLLEEHFKIIKKDDFLFNSIRLLNTGNSYLYIADSKDIAEKIKNFIEKHKKVKGIKKEFLEFSLKYTYELLLDKIIERINDLKKSGSVLWVDT